MKILNNVNVDNQLTLEQLNTTRVALSSNPNIGVLSWNNEDGTADLTLKGGSVVLQIGQEFHARVYNAETFSLVPGDVVYAYGAMNGHTSVKLANASSEETSRNIVGVITEVIPSLNLGFATIMGKVRELNTSAYLANEALYLSTVNGKFTNIKPQSPNHVVSIGWVSEVSATQGSIRLNIHVVPNADEISYDNNDSGLIGTNVKSAIDELQFKKADIGLLSSNITLYPTNDSSDIGGYYKLVSSISDPSYNTTTFNMSSGSITTSDQLINSFVASPNLFVGNPGYINITTIGNIRKISGNNNQYAEFFFRVYKRTAAGVETLISTSNTTGLIQNTSYVEFSATAILNNGVFVDTDRIVIKHFANILSGSGPVYEFEFGGVTPTRTLFPVPVSVIPSGNASSIIVDTSSFNGILDGTNNTIQSALNKIDDHTHDNRYYTEFEIDSMLNGLSSAAEDISISDIGAYYTSTNVEGALQEIGVALTNVSGDAVDISIADTNNYFTSTHVEGALQEVGANLLTKANSTHNHIIGDVNGLQLALDAKAPLASPSLTGTPVAPTAAVGTNTTQLATTAFVNAEIANDAAAKVHNHTIAEVTSLQTTLNGLQPISEKGVANGYASLGADGKVPSTQLPSFVDDVLEYAALASFPTIGETGKIYIALDTNKTYRWSGSTYVYITSGAVDSVAGKTGVVTLVKADVGLSNVDNTADNVKSVSKAATLTTPRTLTIGSTGKNFDGSTNVSWTLTEIGAAKQAINEATATDGQVLTANGDGTFVFEVPSSAASMSIFSEEFTASEGQTNFTLTTGSYSPGNNRLVIYIWGLRQHATAFTETSGTTFALAAGVPAGTKVLAEWRVADATLRGDNGADGLRGPSGVSIETTEPADPDVMIWLDPNGSTLDLNATSTSITDSNSYYASDNVEGALQEIGFNLSTKAPLASPSFTGTVSGITKAMVGLENVDNTSDAAKPISTATQTALNNKAIKPTNEDTATNKQILQANGDGTSTYVDFSGGGQLLGTAAVKAISYNAQVINENITIPAAYNAMSVGPISIGDGFTVTVEDGAVWVII